MMTRRTALKATALAATACAANLTQALAQQPAAQPVPAPAAPGGPFTLPPLPYEYDALEPYIDAETMKIHHDKHHAAYVANLNKAVAGHPDLEKKSVDDLLRDLNAIPENIREAVRNNGGGHYNHSLFWGWMKKGGGEPGAALASAIAKNFGSFAQFKEQFIGAAVRRFGSGWAWLVYTPERTLQIQSTANQDTPWSSGLQVIFGLDVWEHAYYLKYKNVRPDYCAAWFNVINWERIDRRFSGLTSF